MVLTKILKIIIIISYLSLIVLGFKRYILDSDYMRTAFLPGTNLEEILNSIIAKKQSDNITDLYIIVSMFALTALLIGIENITKNSEK